MKICFLNMPIEYYSPISGGAISTIIAHQARHLIERNHDVTIVTPVNDKPVYDIGKIVPIATGRKENLSFAKRAAYRVTYKLRRWDWPYFEVYLNSAMNALKSLSPTPEVVVVHNDLRLPRHIKRVLPGARVVVVLQNEVRTRQTPAEVQDIVDSVHRFVCCSGYIKDWTRKAYGIPEEKMVVNLNGVDTSAYVPRADYLEPTSPLKVLFMGRFDPNKGPDLAADAVATLRSEGLPVELAVAGAKWWYQDGTDSDPYLKELSASLERAEANVLGLVPRADLPGVVRGYDVVVVPSRSQEPCTLTAMEGMSSGCAVIASRRGGLPEMCGGNAMLFDPDEPGALADCLRTLATDQGALRRWKQVAREYAFSKDWRYNTQVLARAMDTVQPSEVAVPAAASGSEEVAAVA
jgi:glycosyltransferase involved in cell wall biosynthesis